MFEPLTSAQKASHTVLSRKLLRGESCCCTSSSCSTSGSSFFGMSWSVGYMLMTQFSRKELTMQVRTWNASAAACSVTWSPHVPGLLMELQCTCTACTVSILQRLCYIHACATACACNRAHTQMHHSRTTWYHTFKHGSRSCTLAGNYQTNSLCLLNSMLTSRSLQPGVQANQVRAVLCC